MPQELYPVNEHILDFMVNAALAFIMFGVGLSLTINDFRHIFRYPRPLILGLSAQLLVMPAVAFLIAVFAPLPAAVRVGIVIISICPGGSSSNVIVFMLKGNLALSISLIIINTIVTLFTIPALTNLSLHLFLDQDVIIRLPFFETVLQIFLITIIPVYLGITLRHFKPDITRRLEKPLEYILPSVLLVVFALKIFVGESSGGTGILFSEALTIFPYVFALNFFGMFFGLLVAWLGRVKPFNQLTIAIEVGLQNTALALVVGGFLQFSSAIEKPVLVYAGFSFFTAYIFGYILKRISRKSGVWD